MREFQLRSQPTILTTLKEPPKKGKNKKVKWQRISFLLVAFAIVCFIGVQLYIRLAVIQANAQLELKKQLVQFPSDIKIHELYIAEGEEIEKGDTLLKYTIPVDDQLTTSEINIDKPIEWILRERISTQKQIELKKIQSAEVERQLAMRRGLHETKKELILLGSYNDRNEYEELSIQINRLEAEKAAIGEEVAYLGKLLYRLNIENANYKRIETRKKEIIEESHFYVAKLDGVIGQINYNENEICYRKDELLTIHRNKDVRIKAFFDPSDMQYLNEGDLVDINYPDKTSSKGVITNFHVATYALPSEFQKKYEPTERNIVAEVQMLEDTQKPLMSYYKMNVLVSKNRYNL